MDALFKDQCHLYTYDDDDDGVVVIDSVTFVWALYTGCVSIHGAERHIWHTWLRLLLLLFSFFPIFDFADDEKSSVKVMIHTKPALAWG